MIKRNIVIVDALSKNGYEVVAHPLKKSDSEAKIKSNNIDARILADLVRGIYFQYHEFLQKK